MTGIGSWQRRIYAHLISDLSWAKIPLLTKYLSSDFDLKYTYDFFSAHAWKTESNFTDSHHMRFEADLLVGFELDLLGRVALCYMWHIWAGTTTPTPPKWLVTEGSHPPYPASMQIVCCVCVWFFVYLDVCLAAIATSDSGREADADGWSSGSFQTPSSFWKFPFS